MAEDVKPDVIKKTQDLLGKYFKKPPLTDKLLKKPPFRFLHDIVQAVIKETGFLDGLFSEHELNSDNVKDKESKLAFLSKLIEVVELSAGTRIGVRASKIVAGLEPTKTNELLQAIGKCVDKKISSAEAIEQYKTSKSATKKPSKTKLVKEEPSKKPSSKHAADAKKPDKVRSTVEKKKSTTKTLTKEPKLEKQDSKEKAVTQEKENKKDAEREKKNREVAEVQNKPEKERQSTAKVRQASPANSNQEIVTNGLQSESPQAKVALSDTTNSPTHKVQEPRPQTRKESKRRHSAKLNSSTEKLHQDDSLVNSKGAEVSEPEKTIKASETEKRQKTSESERKHKSSEPEKKTKTSEPEKLSRKDSKELAEVVNVNSTPVANLEKPPKASKDVHIEPKNDAHNESFPKTGPMETVTRPSTSLRPLSARPSSARPAAPRMRSKVNLPISEDLPTSGGNINVIVENFDVKEDDDDVGDMVVVENGYDALQATAMSEAETNLSQEHGYLVAQILETQRELINTDDVDVIPKKVEIEWEAGSRRDRESVIKEVDKLRATIQTLTQNTNPLGKLLDYLQEDVEIMRTELQDWRSQYVDLTRQLEVERTRPEQSAEPMKQLLQETENNIAKELNKIRVVKSNMIKNNEKIQRLLNGHL